MFFIQDGDTPLMLALEKGHLGCAELLINNGANLNALNAVSACHSIVDIL